MAEPINCRYEADKSQPYGIANRQLTADGLSSLRVMLPRKNQDVNQKWSSSRVVHAWIVRPVQTNCVDCRRQPLFRWDAWEGLKQVKTSINLSEINLQITKTTAFIKCFRSLF